MGWNLRTIAIVCAAGCGPSTALDEPSPATPAPASKASGARDGARVATLAEPLGLTDGAVWRFRGTWTRWDDDLQRDVDTPLEWTTRVLRVRAGGAGTEHWIEGWPGDAPGRQDRVTVLTFVDGAVHLRAAEDAAPGGPWLRLPLRAGTAQCEDELGYCWVVEEAEGGHDVILRTNPDVTTYRIEPRRGVTRFEYHHNGTTNDIVLERID